MWYILGCLSVCERIDTLVVCAFAYKKNICDLEKETEHANKTCEICMLSFYAEAPRFENIP